MKPQTAAVVLLCIAAMLLALSAGNAMGARAVVGSSDHFSDNGNKNLFAAKNPVASSYIVAMEQMEEELAVQTPNTKRMVPGGPSGRAPPPPYKLC
ncbi:hypothetical protein Cni_G09644 [Canna indica]|uniref:Uncharacterized protein n=1 Tax=Canna indica TaxID=4628 RepID=A0AAQ3Q939_9LILI|nr:hypothetical protein Cni_G09644 [Canna indica]